MKACNLTSPSCASIRSARATFFLSSSWPSNNKTSPRLITASFVSQWAVVVQKSRARVKMLMNLNEICQWKKTSPNRNSLPPWAILKFPHKSRLSKNRKKAVVSRQSKEKITCVGASLIQFNLCQFWSFFSNALSFLHVSPCTSFKCSPGCKCKLDSW